MKALLKEVREMKELLKENLEFNRKQTEAIIAWKDMDKRYHKKTLNKLDGGKPPASTSRCCK